MTATLRVVLDQVAAPTRPDLAEASRELARALVATTPGGCDVAAIVPSIGDVADAVPGLADVTRLSFGRREMAASWPLGVVPGVGKGMIHAPTLLAPLVRHDRVNETHQIVATAWDLRAWEAPGELSRGEAMFQRAMLKRAERFADAVVVPSHALARRLADRTRLGGRIRVIAGAAPAGFRVPNDVVGRLRGLGLPDAFVATAGGRAETDGLDAVFHALAAARTERDVVVLDTPEGEEPAVVELAAAAGIPERRVHVRGALETFDRAAVLGTAAVFVAGSRRADWPWRIVEALAAGIPVVAADTDVHREVLADAGLVAPPAELAGSVELALGDAAPRLRVLSVDRAQGFSWREAAERTWQLHADL